MFELLLKLSKGTYTLAINNRTLLKRMCQEQGMSFSFASNPSFPTLNQINIDHLSRVSLLKISGILILTNDINDVEEMLAKLDPRKVQIESLIY